MCAWHSTKQDQEPPRQTLPPVSYTHLDVYKRQLVCRLLEVSRSGYYEWLGRKPSLRRQKDQELKRRLLSLHQRYPALGLDSLYPVSYTHLDVYKRQVKTGT